MKTRLVRTDLFSVGSSMIRWMAPVVVFLTTGCATIQALQFEQPGFDLTSVRIDGLGLTGGSLTLLIDVNNPNAYDLRTGQIDVALDFEGTRFADALLDRNTRFGSQAVTPIELPISFMWAGVGAGARALLERGEVGYALATRLTVDTPLGDRPVAMTTRGNVPVGRLIR